MLAMEEREQVDQEEPRECVEANSAATGEGTKKIKKGRRTAVREHDVATTVKVSEAAGLPMLRDKMAQRKLDRKVELDQQLIHRARGEQAIREEREGLADHVRQVAAREYENGRSVLTSGFGIIKVIK
eukprot:TRINITY_DN78659_c0_g1_i1.p2 TRINITY_DN78659_c0_g1~~TRINITY_DN78659_c0_g1_i1.p2  ORF type:complete len:128 (-),score=22.19 TRINITY_DN78659_c0_g1_i1:13-396(-)